jgi:hypothetical protein
LRFVLAMLVAGGMAGLCGSAARAATEFCPAQLIGADSKSAASEHYYRLRALGPRVVEGTIVADTDRGWFSWDQKAVQLTRITYTRSEPGLEAMFVVAESPELGVLFPQSVDVRRAWVAAATTRADAYWDARGKTACGPPDFTESSSADGSKVTRTPQSDDPTPAPAPPAATARVIPAPIPLRSCVQPFVAAAVTKSVTPDFPDSVKREGFSAPATSIIFVAVDASGTLADAWVFASSGYPALDDAAIRAARQSTYTAPVSYCHAVSGTYLFRADFMPY